MHTPLQAFRAPQPQQEHERQQQSGRTRAGRDRRRRRQPNRTRTPTTALTTTATSSTTRGSTATGQARIGRTAASGGSLFDKIKRFQAVDYTALQQRDVEAAGNRTPITGSEPSDSDSNSEGGSSSSLEDLFPSGGQVRRVRRKMTRKGTYTMRDTFETSRQFWSAFEEVPLPVGTPGRPNLYHGQLPQQQRHLQQHQQHQQQQQQQQQQQHYQSLPAALAGPQSAGQSQQPSPYGTRRSQPQMLPFQGQQVQVQCVHHTPLRKHQQREHPPPHAHTHQQQLPAGDNPPHGVKWSMMAHNGADAEFDDFHYQNQNQGKQSQQQQQQQLGFYSRRNCGLGESAACGKRYITPGDIPPPPHPPQQQQQQQQHPQHGGTYADAVEVVAAGGARQAAGNDEVGAAGKGCLHTGSGGCRGGVAGGCAAAGGSAAARLAGPAHTRCCCDTVQLGGAGSGNNTAAATAAGNSADNIMHSNLNHANHIGASLPLLPPHQHHQQQLQRHQQQQQQHAAPHHFSGCLHSHLTSREQQQHTPYREVFNRNPDQLLTPPPPPSQHQRHSKWSSYASALTRPQKNLVYSHEKIRRVRIILGVICGVITLALLATALYFILRDTSTSPDASQNGIHLEDILTGKLAAKRFNGTWSTGSNIIFVENFQIIEYDVKTNKRTVLFEDKKQLYVLHEKSADGEYLLLAKNFQKHFRHSYQAEYDILNISSGEIVPIKISNEQRLLLMVQWAPVGNGLVVNFERNLYYKPTALAEEIIITNDDKPAIINGIPDWVYEEEVFSSNIATWFNPNGTMLAFIQFDNSPTRVMNIPYYGEAGDLRYQYPYSRAVIYPKAGSSNPNVKVFTADLINAAEGQDFLKPVPVPVALNTETDYIISVVNWLSNEKLLSVWMNRIQNLAYLQISDTLKRTELYHLESKSGWVDLFAAPYKNRDGSRIALILPQTQDGGVQYRHLCLLSTTSANAVPEPLTKGKYVVQAILHWDTTRDVIFYKANTEQNSEVVHVYSIRAVSGQTPQCLSCKLQTSGDIEQTYYSADFSTANEVVISSNGPGIPMHIVYSWSYTNNQVELTKLLDWETNEALRAHLQHVSLPSMEIHTFPITSKFTAKVLLQLPPNMDRSGNTKYPMLVDVYGGPDSFSVIDKWMMDWGTYLSSNQSVIYAKIDGRGSGLRGDELLHSIYLQLGTVEISDQIEVTKQLQQKFSFIDASHTGIWGWSYGGYAASMALANDNSSVFNCAAAIAPVTDWAYYDSIYTERYMSLPTLNELGYAASRLSTRANKLRGKKYLLVHGTLDDNVHYQQSMILAKNLERADILFKQISYPDEDHSLGGVRPHLYHSLDRFFGDCFNNKRMMHSRW